MLHTSDGATIRLETQEIDRLCKSLLRIQPANQIVDLERENILNYLVQEIHMHRSRVIYLEVQHTIISNKTGEVAEYRYVGGTAVAIGRHHLLTALHVVQPEEEWLVDEHGNIRESRMKILQTEPMVDSDDGLPHETDRWNRNGEFYLMAFDDTCDIALLSSELSFLRIPLCYDPICEGVKIFTIDVKDPACPKIFDGRCWPSDASAGEFYDFTAFADHGFSGGPIVGIFHFKIILITLDRHGALVGLCLSDAGKKRIMGRFVSLPRIIAFLAAWNPNWKDIIKCKISVYEHPRKRKEPQSSPIHTIVSPHKLRAADPLKIDARVDKILTLESDRIQVLAEYYQRFYKEWNEEDKTKKDTVHSESWNLDDAWDIDDVNADQFLPMKEREAKEGTVRPLFTKRKDVLESLGRRNNLSKFTEGETRDQAIDERRKHENYAYYSRLRTSNWRRKSGASKLPLEYPRVW